MAVSCHRSNLSAFCQDCLSCSKSPVSSLKAAYFEGCSGILQNKNCCTNCVALLMLFVKKNLWDSGYCSQEQNFSWSHCPVIWFVRPYALIHSCSSLQRTAVCLDPLEVFKNKRKSNIYLCCLQAYPSQWKAEVSTKSSCLVPMYAQREHAYEWVWVKNWACSGI